MSKNNKPNIWSPFFMNEFKKWMDNHEKQVNDISVGKHVGTNLDIRHLIERMDCVEVENDTIDLAKYFLKKGGIVRDNAKETVFIKTKKGSFYLPKSDVYETDL